MTKDISDKLMNRYQQRKNWYGHGRFQEMAEFFGIETARSNVRSGDLLLEIGFGEGLFLDWARYKGYDITGVEINSDFYSLAKKRGHQVFFGQPDKVLNECEKKFHGIFLFDVLEHLTLEEICRLLTFLQTILTSNGHILVRVPNGASPFGRYLQHGDATHKSVLSVSWLMDVAPICRLQVKAAYNGARSAGAGKHKKRILKKMAYGVRDILQLVIGYVYYGENIPLDPQLTVVMGHQSEEGLPSDL